MQQHFDVIGFEIFDDSEMTAPDGKAMRVKEFAAHMGAEFSPTLVFLDTEGRVLLRVVGYYPPQRFTRALDFLSSDAHRDGLFGEYEARIPSQADTNGQPMIRDELFESPPTPWIDQPKKHPCFHDHLRRGALKIC